MMRKYACFVLGFSLSLGSLFYSSPAFADTSSVDEIVIDVPSSCSLESTGNTSHTATIANGNSTANIGTTTLKAYCNDNNGFAIYAIGYTDNTEGKNVLTSSTLGSDYDIITGTTMSGTSKWAMKLATSGTATYPITLQNNFNNYHDVPDDYTLVAKRTAGTDTGTSATGASLTTTYEAYISTTQPAGTYVGQVKYTLVHPNTALKPETLYSKVAKLVKTTNGNPKTQTLSELQAVITTPTSNNPATDTSNSGVFLYDASTYGTASDASNDFPIYYYRGILDSDLDNTISTYGSNGNGAYYPNYVRLGNTCWRIVRTTGSGGVKMIFNGNYGTTNPGSCANSLTNAQIIAGAFSGTTTTRRQVVRVGYTYKNTYAVNTNYNVSISTAFGSNTDYASNTTDSTIKDYIENTWFSGTNGIGAYESILEPSAGYCNDRSAYASYTSTAPLDESTTINTYTSSTTPTFGPVVRELTSATLSCPRNVVDLYTTSLATNGNKQLSKPVAILTLDEAAFAGSGYNNDPTTIATSYSNNSYNSYLRSGSYFWLLSPANRYSSGVSMYYVIPAGSIASDFVSGSYGVRPVISLEHETVPVSGSGTATDPWVVVAP